MIPSEVLGGHRILKESFSDELDKYLNELSETAPNPTYLSHQTALSTFAEWRLQQNLIDDYIEPVQVCDFIGYSLTGLEHSPNTIGGYSCSISNFISYCWREDPLNIKAKIAFYFRRSDPERYDSIGNEIFGFVGSNNSLDEFDPAPSISLLQYLRQRKFGTRNHVYVELIHDTHSRSRQVLNIDIEDLNISDKTVVIDIPSTHVVSKVDLVTERVANLSPRTVEAIEQYIEYERNEQTENRLQPLLTTSHGRASASTLRRATKQASKKALKKSISECISDAGFESKQQSQSTTVGPNDVWRNSILNIVRGQ